MPPVAMFASGGGGAIASTVSTDEISHVNELFGASELWSGARTTAFASAAKQNPYGRGIAVYMDVTNGTTPLLTPTIETQDPVSLKWVVLLTGVQVTAIGFTSYCVYPSASLAGYTLAVNTPLGRVWRVQVAVGNANSITYSLGACVLL